MQPGYSHMQPHQHQQQLHGALLLDVAGRHPPGRNGGGLLQLGKQQLTTALAASAPVATKATAAGALPEMAQIDRKCEPYYKAVFAVAERYLKHMPPSQRSDMRRLFNTWKDAPDKLDVSFMYKLSGWRAVYTQNLFRSRIQTVWLSLRQLMSPRSGIADQLADILDRTQRIVSIGCGPGPCIAAMLIVLRECVGLTKYIKLIGVDQFIGWGPYVVSMNGVEAAGASSVEFWHDRVEEATIDKLPNADIAIMSYTDAAAHTPNFWQTMRLKYAFILVLDQRKGALSRELQRQGFCHFEYEFKGSKRVFYYINPFGEFLKLAHSTAAAICVPARLHVAAAADDSESVSSGSSSCSSSSPWDDEGGAVVPGCETEAKIERQVLDVMRRLLDKVEQRMSLGLARTRTRVRQRAIQAATEAAAAADAAALTRKAEEAEDDTEDVSPELERAITQRLLEAVDSMKASNTGAAVVPAPADGVVGPEDGDELALQSNAEEVESESDAGAEKKVDNTESEKRTNGPSSPSHAVRVLAVRKRPPAVSRVKRARAASRPSTGTTDATDTAPCRRQQAKLSKAEKDQLLHSLLKEVSPEPDVVSDETDDGVTVQVPLRRPKPHMQTQMQRRSVPVVEEKVLSIHMPEWARELISSWSNRDAAPPVEAAALVDPTPPVDASEPKTTSSFTRFWCPPPIQADVNPCPPAVELKNARRVPPVRQRAPPVPAHAPPPPVPFHQPHPQVRRQQSFSSRPVGIARPAPHESSPALSNPSFPPQSGAASFYYPSQVAAPVTADVFLPPPEPLYQPAVYVNPLYHHAQQMSYCYIVPGQPQIPQQPQSVPYSPMFVPVPPGYYEPEPYHQHLQHQQHQLKALAAQSSPIAAVSGTEVAIPVVPASVSVAASVPAPAGIPGGISGLQKSATSKKRKHRKGKKAKKTKKDGHRRHKRSSRHRGGERRRKRERRCSSSLSSSDGTISDSSSRSSSQSRSRSRSRSRHSDADVVSPTVSENSCVEEFVSEDSDLDTLDCRRNRALAEEAAARARKNVAVVDDSDKQMVIVESRRAVSKKFRLNRDAFID